MNFYFSSGDSSQPTFSNLIAEKTFLPIYIIYLNVFRLDDIQIY